MGITKRYRYAHGASYLPPHVWTCVASMFTARASFSADCQRGAHGEVRAQFLMHMPTHQEGNSWFDTTAHQWLRAVQLQAGGVRQLKYSYDGSGSLSLSSHCVLHPISGQTGTLPESLPACSRQLTHSEQLQPQPTVTAQYALPSAPCICTTRARQNRPTLTLPLAIDHALTGLHRTDGALHSMLTAARATMSC